MNYRHAYHAGNHADVLKHVAMARAIDHLKKKDTPFRVIDAHAGAGRYDLLGPEASRTREWEGGVGRLARPFAADVEQVIASYRQVLDTLNPSLPPAIYPGSPELVLRLMRPQDRLVANELHPEDALTLQRQLGFDPRLRVTAHDALIAIKAELPPPERRGLILIDPPYETADEAERVIAMLRQGLRRFARGVFIVWYPLKAGETAAQVCEGIRALGAAATLRIELRVREAFAGGGLAGSGLVVVNPPWQFEADMAIAVAALAERLGLGSWGHGQCDWLVPPA